MHMIKMLLDVTHPMLIYAFYNANLIDRAKSKSELSTGFINDCAFVAVTDTLEKAHNILKNMMECPSSRLDWSYNHNSPFKITKLAAMDFARTSNNATTPLLIINKTNTDSTRNQHTITMVNSYKYLGVVFDLKFSWSTHVTKVIAKASWWTQQLWRLSKTVGSLSPSKTYQLYNTFAVPAFTCAYDV